MVINIRLIFLNNSYFGIILITIPKKSSIKVLNYIFINNKKYII